MEIVGWLPNDILKLLETEISNDDKEEYVRLCSQLDWLQKGRAWKKINEYLKSVEDEYMKKIMSTRWQDFETRYSINDVYKELIQLIWLFKDLPKILISLNK